MNIRRSKPAMAFASGFPETTLVTAARNKRLGDSIMLVNGTNAFCVPATGFQSIRLVQGDGLISKLVGTGQGGTDTVLGQFGNFQAGQNAHAALMRQYAGIKAQASSSGWWKWAAAAAVLVVLMAAFSRGATATAGAGDDHDLAQMKAAVTANLQKQSDTPGSFDPNEPSMDQGATQPAAAGAYNFGAGASTTPSSLPSPSQQIANGRAVLDCAAQK